MIEGLAGIPKLLVASDFDGTLAEIVEDPDLATPLARSMTALEQLADQEGTTVAIISGRRRSELVSRFPHPAFVLIGEHGADHGQGGTPESAALTRARRLVETVVAQTPGARVEHKARSVGFHYRQVPDPESALTILREKARAIDGLERIEGKKIVELTDSPVDKGSALLALKESTGAHQVLFMGDDVTDETAFAVLGPTDVGVHVGIGPTAATVTVPDPSALADLLETLSSLRAAREP